MKNHTDTYAYKVKRTIFQLNYNWCKEKYIPKSNKFHYNK